MRKLLLLLLLLIPQVAHAILPNYCRRFQLPGWWGSGEYMLVWRKERYYPPLVTTSPLGTPLEEGGDFVAGVLGLPTTRVLFGDEHVGNSPESGCRFDAGFWLTRCIGFGATWTAFGKEHVDYSIDSNADGVPIIAVPFFDSGNNIESIIPISYPDILGSSTLDIDADNNIWAADIYARWRFWSRNCLWIDLLGGFRYVHMNDSFNMTTSANDLDPLDNLFGFDTFDSFSAQNTFYSGLVGVIGEYRNGKWAFQLCGRFGIGNMVKKVNIEGQTIGVDVLGPFVIPEGIFAQSTNIGTHSENSFEVVSEAEAKIGYYVWPNLMVTLGYHFMYWPKIFLAADQIDRNLNFVDTVPPDPQFPGRDSNFWTQSLTVGIYFLY